MERWVFWATVYTLVMMIPLSIPRRINSLRYLSFLGVFSWIVLVIFFVAIFFFDRNLVPSISENFKNAVYFELSYKGIISVLPFVFFSFLYHPNVPIVYRELKMRNHSMMSEIIIIGTIFVLTVYILMCTFGYLGLVNKPEYIYILLLKCSSLEINYDNFLFTIAITGFLFAIFASAPVSMLPAKDTVEYLLYPDQVMNFKQNIIVTMILCLTCYILAVALPGVGEIISFLGCTANPMVGYILPVIFYLTIFPNCQIWQKLVSCWILLFSVTLSIMGIIELIQKLF